jgi:hypothetical protein
MQRMDYIPTGDVDRFGNGTLASVDPPQCRSLLRPVDVSVGSDVARIYAPGPSSDISMMAVKLTDPLTADLPVQGCDRVGYTLDGGQPGGTVERIEAPHIDGAKTQAIKYQVSADPVAFAYEYAAFLGDRVVITLRTSRKQDSPEPPGLSALLGDAASAVQGTYTPPPSNAPPQGPDISRLATLKDEFPQGLKPSVLAPYHLSDIDAVELGRVVGSKSTVFDPPECVAALQPVRQTGNTLGTALSALQRGGPSVVVGASQSQHLLRAETPAGCDHVRYSSRGEHGAVDRLTPPVIEGAETFAFENQYTDGYGKSGTRYFYSAILDDNVYIDVWGQLDPDAESQQALLELLAKAVAAVRGM